MAEKFGKQVKIYYTNNKQTTSVTGIDASSYILFNGGSNHIYTHGKDFAADPSHTHKFLELSDVKDTFSKPADTTNTWVPVDVNGKIYHREIPVAYNHDPSTLSVNSANTANIANIANSLYASCASNDYIGIKGGGSNDNGYLEIYTGDNGNEPIYLRQYKDSSVAIHSATLLDSNGNTSFPGTISSNGHTVLTNRIDPIISVACTSSGILTFTSNNNNKYEFNFNHTHDLSQLTGKIKVECLPDAALKDTTYSYSVTQSATNNNANPYLTLTPSNSGTVSNIQLAGGSNVTITRDSASKIIISSSWRPLGTGSNDAAAGNHNHDHITVNVADTSKFNSSYHDFQVLYAGEGNGIEGRPSDVDAFGLLRFRVASGWSGQMLLADGGDLYIRSANDGSFNKSLPWKRIIDSGNIGSQSVAYANSAGNADTVDGVHLDWSTDYTAGDYLAIWDNDGEHIRPIPKGSVSVGYANSAGYATSAGSVAWGNVTGRPSSLPASDVYPWAKASSKPSYNWSEIGSKPSTFTPSAHNHDVISFLGNHNETASGTTGNAANAGMAKTSGLFATGTYNDNATPTAYGNIINIAGIGGSQLLLGWSGTNSVTDKVYYRSHRDNGGGWGEWKQLAYTTDLIWGNISGRPSSLPANGGNADYATNATNADTAIKLKDYNGSNNIYCGWAGEGLTSDNIGWMVGIKANPTGSNDIYYKDVSKSELQKWLGLDSYVKKSGDTMSGYLYTTNIELFAPTPYIDFHYNNSSSDYTSRIVEYTSGVLTITGRLEIYNNLSAQGGKFFTDDNGAYWTSDIRKKHDFSNITKDIADKFFEKNYFKHFKWNDTNHDSWGVAAQEFEEWAPEAINTDEDGFKSANYDVAEAKAIAAMTYKIKEQQVTINELKEKLKNFEKMLNKLI